MTQGSVLTRGTRWLGRLAVAAAFTVGVVALLLYLAGWFAPKVPQTPALPSTAAASQGQVVAVRALRVPRIESAVGTIRAVHETTIGSKLLARVLEVNLKAGQAVTAGQVLVRLDDTDLKAKLEQAKAALSSIQAVRDQAVNDERRFAQLRKTNSVSQSEYEKTATALHTANADLVKAQEAVKETQVALDWATILAPFDGVVIDKKVDVGDMVTPGQVLLTLFDPKRMQLVASVRESLAHGLREGQSIGVQVEGLNKQCSGTVSEIVPEAQAASRSFQVKVTGPCPTGIYSGMFGRILIPLEQEEVLVIPRAAVRRVGQLELVNVIEDGHSARRAVRTGRIFGDKGQDVEVLSGLDRSEEVVLGNDGSTAAQEASHE